jgi:hypothetical protein
MKAGAGGAEVVFLKSFFTAGAAADCTPIPPVRTLPCRLKTVL